MNTKYYEDFNVGDRFVTGGRTISEADVMSFCGLAGIFHPLFVDEQYAKKNTLLGTRVVPGPLTYILTVGMWMRLGFFDRSVEALLGVKEMRVHAPVRHGDTLHSEVEIMATRQTSKPGLGILEAKHTTINQNGEKVMDVVMTYMIKCKSHNHQ